jgi:2-iminobutanoate/2-iminopropanoate deaminase
VKKRWGTLGAPRRRLSPLRRMPAREPSRLAQEAKVIIFHSHPEEIVMNKHNVVIGAAAALAFALAASPAFAQSGNNLETIHHPNYDKSVFMPFSPAIKVKSGKLLWLAGGTALPVYHDHPHKREQIMQFMPNDLEAQTRRTMDGIMETLKAAGASPKDVVHVFIFRTRPRTGDIGRSSAVVNSYFAPFNHKPTTTNMAVLELGEPEQLVEIQVVAVVD